VPLLEQVLDKYPKEVKLVFKNYPIKSHKFARKAALAALSAGKEGKFWEFHDKVFENFNRLGDAKIRDIAVEIGLDMDKFEKGLASPDSLELIRRDVQDARNAGVRGTPTIFINGRRLENRSLAGFQAVIDAELKKHRADKR
jgi:protein-disulfide isomerase